LPVGDRLLINIGFQPLQKEPSGLNFCAGVLGERHAGLRLLAILVPAVIDNNHRRCAAKFGNKRLVLIDIIDSSKGLVETMQLSRDPATHKDTARTRHRCFSA
jgi:hypothetical protein